MTDMADEGSGLVTEALRAKCVCGAKPGQLCRNTINPDQPLPGRLVHFVRLELTA